MTNERISSKIFSTITFIIASLVLGIFCVNIYADSEIEKMNKFKSMITDIKISEVDTKEYTNSLTPNFEYDVKIVVEDKDGIGTQDGGLDELIVELWYDKGGDDLSSKNLTKRFFDKNKFYGPNECIRIRWVRGGTATIIGGGKSWSFDFDNSIIPLKKDKKNTNFEFLFRIKIGKVAKEASNVNKWQIGAAIVGVNGNYDLKAFKSVRGYGLPMNFYGEIEINESKLDLIEAMKNRVNMDNRSYVSFEIKNIKYLSNDTYIQAVSGDNEWRIIDNQKKRLIRLLNANSENTFSIKSSIINNEVKAQNLPVSGGDLTIKNNVSGNKSSSPQIKSNFLFIGVNDKFNENLKYVGNINYCITNINSFGK